MFSNESVPVIVPERVTCALRSTPSVPSNCGSVAVVDPPIAIGPCIRRVDDLTRARRTRKESDSDREGECESKHDQLQAFA